jgi:hypothetical protein
VHPVLAPSRELSSLIAAGQRRKRPDVRRRAAMSLHVTAHGPLLIQQSTGICYLSLKYDEVTHAPNQHTSNTSTEHFGNKKPAHYRQESMLIRLKTLNHTKIICSGNIAARQRRKRPERPPPGGDVATCNNISLVLHKKSRIQARPDRCKG